MTATCPPYWQQIAALAGRIAGGEEVVTLGHLAGASKAFFLGHLAHFLQRPLVVITPVSAEAETLVHDLTFFLAAPVPSCRAGWFPASGIPPYEPASATPDITAQRFLCLRSMLQPGRQIVVTTPEAITSRLMPRALLQHIGLDLTVGMTLERQGLIERLLQCGYRQVDLVEEWGEFSVRGGIVDMAPAHLPRPVRLEFVGDDIESMREFDPESQRSSKVVRQVSIVPLREVVPDLPPWSAVEPRALAASLDLPRLQEIFTCLERLIFPPGIERLLPVLCESLESFFDYIPPDAVLVLDEPTVLAATLEEFMTAVHDGYQQALLRHDVVAAPAARYLGRDVVAECWQAFQRVALQGLSGDHAESQLTDTLAGHVIGSFQGRWEAFVQLVGARLKEDYTVLLTAATQTQARHIRTCCETMSLAPRC